MSPTDKPQATSMTVEHTDLERLRQIADAMKVSFDSLVQDIVKYVIVQRTQAGKGHTETPTPN